MPLQPIFVTRQDVEQRTIPVALLKQITGDTDEDNEIFLSAENDAAKIIMQESTQTEPDSTDDTPLTIKSIAARIIAYMLVTPVRVPALTEQSRADIRTQYNEALAELRKLPRTDSDVTTENLYGSFEILDLYKY